MVRKAKTQSDACNSKNSDKTEESDNERKTFLALSFPIVLFFNIIKALLFELFVILKFVYNTSTKILHKPVNPEDVVNLETVKGDENSAAKDLNTMDLLQRQKFHHKRAFEYISQALKIDETQNSGNSIKLSPTVRLFNRSMTICMCVQYRSLNIFHR